MAKGFRRVDRDQQFLLPPDMREWLPEDHLAWFVIDAVGQLDLRELEARRRLGGVGRRGYDPRMMLTLLIYCYADGIRSSRRIERLCHTDVALRVICANDIPDHTTIARFRQDHQGAVAGLFGQVLAVCARAGLGRLGTIAIDGTKIAADAALAASRRREWFVEQAAAVLAEAAATDTAEDAVFGVDRRGDAPPGPLRGRPDRLPLPQRAPLQLAGRVS